MSSTEERLQIARDKNEVAAKRRFAKQTQRPATPSGVIYYFNRKCEEVGYGSPPLLTQKDYHILKMFIKVARKEKEELADEWIYQILSDAIVNWERLKKRHFTNQKGRKWLLASRPNLRDFLICRSSFIANLSMEVRAREKSFIAKPGAEKKKIHQSSATPTKEELDREAEERMYEE